MKTTTLAGALVVLALASTARSQEPAPRSEAEEPESPRRMIRVLQSPYDLASFYSAQPGASSVTPPVPDDPAYALASFYRSRGASGPQPGPWLWAAFWASGYGAHYPTPFVGYRRSIGENGDLFLSVPFLAPLGPLGGGFPGHLPGHPPGHSPGHSPGRSPGRAPGR